MGSKAWSRPHGPTRGGACGCFDRGEPGDSGALGNPVAAGPHPSPQSTAGRSTTPVRRARSADCPGRRGANPGARRRDPASGVNDALTDWWVAAPAVTGSGAGVEQCRLLGTELIVCENAPIMQAGQALEIGYSPVSCSLRSG